MKGKQIDVDIIMQTIKESVFANKLGEIVDDIKHFCLQEDEINKQSEKLVSMKEILEIKYENIWYKMNSLDNSVVLSMLRPIDSRDIIYGTMVFGRNEDEWYLHRICEVLNPIDEFKSYVAEDGCRYGLEGHYVLKDLLQEHVCNR